MPPQHLAQLLSTARMLHEAARNGMTRPLLKGRKFALMCDDDHSDGAMLFRQATTEMGAQCAHLKPTPLPPGTQEQFRQTAVLLSRLYDAVECQGMASEFVAGLARHASVPVYDGLAAPNRPDARLDALIASWYEAPTDRRFAVQAVLVHALDDQ